MQPTLTTLVTRTRNWTAPTYLPRADATYVAQLQALAAQAPGDLQAYYTATNGDRVSIQAVQSDRSVFTVPATDAPLQVPMPESLVKSAQGPIQYVLLAATVSSNYPPVTVSP